MSGRSVFSASPSPPSPSPEQPSHIGDEHAQILAFVFIATIVVFALWLLGILLSVAFMHLAVDIGRNLRAIRHNMADRVR